MNTNPDDKRVGIDERYAAATNSSDLRVTDGKGDADLLIAAAWVPDSFGTLLLRLTSEYDAVKGEHGIAVAEFDRMERVACLLEQTGKEGSEERKKGIKMAEELREMAVAQALSARLFTLMHLKSLRETKQALFSIAVSRVRRLKLDFDDSTTASLVGNALDVYLDRTCHKCQGRGSRGGYGSPVVICRHCNGSGKRLAGSKRWEQERRDFVASMLSEMDRSVARAVSSVAQAIRGLSDKWAAGRAVAGETELAARLQELRTPEAESD
jgi:hypothetical protein